MVRRPKLLLRDSETTRANHEPVPNLVRRFGIRAARAALLLDSANPLAHAVVALPLECGLLRAPCLVVVSIALAPFGKLFVFYLDCSSAGGRCRRILLWSGLRAISSGAEIGIGGGPLLWKETTDIEASVGTGSSWPRAASSRSIPSRKGKQRLQEFVRSILTEYQLSWRKLKRVTSLTLTRRSIWSQQT